MGEAESLPIAEPIADLAIADLAIAELSAPDNEPARGAASKEDRRFYIGLALATVFHSLLFAGFYGADPRTIGDPSGSKDAISVNFVTDAELRGLSAVPEVAKGSPAPPAPPPAPPPSPPTETAAATPPTPPSPPATQPAESVARPPEPVPQPPEPAPVATPTPARETSVPDTALSLKPPEQREPPIEPRPAAPPKAAAPKPAQPTKPDPSRSAKLDLSPPPTFSAPSGGGGGGAGVQRPPGITRSGENDAFARGVISALRKTMPQLIETQGRVTVRITLDADGSLVSTQVVRASNIAGLDRSVVFATRQTSYPFPPRNARDADLVFLITYIYQ